MLNIKIGSPTEMQLFGVLLAKYLKDGDVLCLAGDLGAGKTLLTKSVAQALHVKDAVTSPTFTLLNIYEGDLTVYHFDLYRLDAAEQLVDIGFDEYTQAGGLVLIEWPDKFTAEMPSARLWITITKTEPEGRAISLTPCGERYQQICEELSSNACFRN